MDAATLTATLKKLTDGGASMPKDDALAILKQLKADVKPTEDLLRTTRAGNMMNRYTNSSTDPDVKAAASDVLNSWKKAIRELKEKRKRDEEEKGAAGGAGTPGEGEERDAKRVKAENGASTSADAKPVIKDEKPSMPSTTDEKPATDAKAVKDEAKPTPTTDKSDREVKPLPSRKLSVNEAEYTDASEPVLDTINPDLKTPRTAKGDGVADRIKADAEAGEPDAVRDKTVVMMYDAVGVDSNATNTLLIERAIDIERAVYDQFNGSTGAEYRGKMRSLFLNIKNKDNQALRDRITKGLLPGKTLVTMSNADFASANMKAITDQINEQNLFKAKAAVETQAETDAFKCGKCGQRRTTYYQMQTRSADEPMTTFVTCKNCNNRWKFS